MSVAALIASGCCCDVDPCNCPTTAFTVDWSGFVQFAPDCAVCEALDPENYDPSQVATISSALVTPATIVVERTLEGVPNCKYAAVIEESRRVVQCDGATTENVVAVRTEVTLARNVFGRWGISIRVTRLLNGSDGGLYGTVAELGWLAPMPGGDGACPPTVGAWVWNGTSEPSTVDACWSGIEALPLTGYSRGAVGLS